jgi:hypothetical protein
MRRFPRPFVAAIALALAGTVAGCTSFDPSDMLDFLDTKKPIPGQRRDVFPEGVPGIDPGIPKEYLQGQNTDPNAAPGVPGNPTPNGQPPGGGGQTADAQPADAPPPPAVKPPKNTKVAARRRITAIPKDSSAAPAAQTQQAAPPPAQQQSAFPAPLPGTFQPAPQQ